MTSKALLYKRKILKELCFGNVLSALELSIRIEKSLPLTTRILNELVDEQILKESGYASSTGGRRPQRYSLVAGKMYVVSVAMDQLVTRIGIIDLQNCDISLSQKYNLVLSHNDASLSTLTKYINGFIKKSGIKKDKILGVGIGMPGFVDVDKGVNYSFLDHKGESIPAYIEEIIELPVFIDNDSSVIALTELKLGSAINTKNTMVINLGWGVGLGMIINGKLFRGNNGFAGEFSHIPLFENNKLCACGKSGCLETETSLLVVIEKAKKELDKGRVSIIKKIPADFEEACNTIISAAINGDQMAVELLLNMAYDLGKGIATLIHIFNPELIVLSGRGASAGNMLLAPIQHAINKYCIPRLSAYTKVIISTFSKSAELIGGAALVIENYDKKHSKQLITLLNN
ncbi:ROK family protein [Ginsengibacter hankyongi]|uniref:ROK family protein n=1 Tax=Ginsengibacter hankyongi TaxID=2607284 RepID=A0A5J5IBH6_9BACT|nr:ROK family protein [Ginsengibacter hankyongi]KAA9036287.1 ROK family protein [Ginsengibacter hankyongi]